MTIRLYNTLTRQKELFEPLDPERVTMYACGPTVYSYAHIGNARPAVIFDLLHKVLQRTYPQVIYARNITDVEDKINAAAVAEGVAIEVITKRFTRAYHEDMAALGTSQPSVEPRATEHIAEMISMISRLIESGHAYEADGHVLFNILSFAEYGALSGRDLEDMVAGSRVEVAPYKQHPGDFVLWKPSVEPQPGWDSPWGWGRPGWHIECSAMAEKHLGKVIDIHAGGQDLVFPHHENEIAQSVCSHNGQPFARVWLHNGFLTFDRRKMSKSLGNILTVNELLKHHRGEVLRYQLLSAHYRQPLDWSDQGLERSQRTLDRMYAVLRNAAEKAGPFVIADQPGNSFMHALNDDINTPEALAVLNTLCRALATAKQKEEIQQLAGELLANGKLIGLLQQDPHDWFTNESSDDDELVERLITEREQARAARDFVLADKKRDQLSEMGIILEDGSGGTRWRRGK
ncbi:MAG: cysteinyl-tRNA synthetase [Lysobacterales bacterium]|jgi:cysteinyl-tRNA synthetase